MYRIALAAGVALCFATAATAQEVSIADIRTQAFLERSGKLSDDLSTTDRALKSSINSGMINRAELPVMSE